MYAILISYCRYLRFFGAVSVILGKMILFKVSFVNNVATKAEFTHSRQPVEWKENPYSIISLEVYANNNVQALELAQQKANALLKGKR